MKGTVDLASLALIMQPFIILGRSGIVMTLGAVSHDHHNIIILKAIKVYLLEWIGGGPTWRNSTKV